ncbi:FkbM family methyltransferase [Oxynema aestuarii]|uniref:FkbM family methyltransferase n=1 Tax=Oxynema aestuarii AP17 TaxID=2064643 RepID=A0A6H1TZF1_9CYAN|nr:FkbM family methyltransferase [Oxynema aestuarii]QIZ71785.1 FkbM family methyltransferase [Oxynema aestuarii AP17]
MAVFLKSLKKSGHLEKVYITICNVGSRKVNQQDDYATQGWEIFAPRLNIYGFDADLDACDRANSDLKHRQVNWKEKHIPIALSNSVGLSTLYVTQHPMCSSLYPPNEIYLDRFTGLPELVNLDFSIEIETTTLDDVCITEKISEIDFLQIDVQGADLQVLEGASKILSKSVLTIQVEVEFSELYSNQPLFADVDIYLRKHGFTLFDLTKAYRRRRHSPIHSTVHPGQLLWGDAFYFRDLIEENLNTDLKNPETILKLACIADVLEFSDYALELLEYLTINYGDDPNYNFASDIIQSLSQFPELVDRGLNSLPIVQRIYKLSNLDSIE